MRWKVHRLIFPFVHFVYAKTQIHIGVLIVAQEGNNRSPKKLSWMHEYNSKFQASFVRRFYNSCNCINSKDQSFDGNRYVF